MGRVDVDRSFSRCCVALITSLLAVGCTELAVLGSGGATGADGGPSATNGPSSTAGSMTAATSGTGGSCAATWQRAVDGAAGIESEGKLFWASTTGVDVLDRCSGERLSAIALDHPKPALFADAGSAVLVASTAPGDPGTSLFAPVVEGFDPITELATVSPIVLQGETVVTLRAISYEPLASRVWLAGSYGNGTAYTFGAMWSAAVPLGEDCIYELARDEGVFVEIIDGALHAVAYDGDDALADRSLISTFQVTGCNAGNIKRRPVSFPVHAARHVGGDLYVVGAQGGVVRLERYDLATLDREAAATVDVSAGVDEGRSLATDGTRIWIGGTANAGGGGPLSPSTGFVSVVPLDFADGTQLEVTPFDDLRSAEVALGEDALYVWGPNAAKQTLLRRCTRDVVCD